MGLERVNVSNLSPYQEFLSKKFPGKNAKLTGEQLAQAADEFFGPIPIPPGSTVIYRNGGGAEYIDPEGYRHQVRRQLDGRDPSAGQIQDNTDRPAVLPPAQGQNNLLSQLTGGTQGLAGEQLSNALLQARGETPAALDPGIQQYLDQIAQLSGQLQQNPTLQGLDPQTAAALEAINARDQAFLKEQFENQQAEQLANLFGNRIQQSSIATNALARLLQEQGLVSAQQRADAAQRDLAIRQFLTNQLQGNRQLALQGLQQAAQGKLAGFQASNQVSQGQTNALLDLLNQLSGQATQRDITAADIGQRNRALAEQARQADLNFQLNQQNADLQLAQVRAASGGPLETALGIAATLATAPIGGLGGASLLSKGLGALGGLFGGTQAAGNALGNTGTNLFNASNFGNFRTGF